MLEEIRSPCIFHCDTAIGLTSQVRHIDDVKERSIRDYVFSEGSVLSTLLGPAIRRREAMEVVRAEAWVDKEIRLEPGEWVDVRPFREIRATLGQDGTTKGLSFMPEMEAFCGRRFKVAKMVRRIVLETTGELRELKVPTVLLKGAACDGTAHHGCDRSCPCFWREQWLKRVP